MTSKGGTDVTQTERQFVNGYGKLLSQSDVDARGGVPRKLRALVRALARDLGDDLPLAQMMLLQRVAMIEALCTHSEAALLLGQDVSLNDYLQMVSTQRRLLQTLGLKRVPKDVSPTLADIIREAQT
jgi:hypothetical protein